MNRREFLASLTAASLARRSNPALNRTGFCTLPIPPVTPKKPLRIVQLGRVRVDNYAWLKDPHWKEVWRDPQTLSPEIKSYLEAQNAYAEAVLAPTRGLQDQMYAEMTARSAEDISAPPQPDGVWEYYNLFPPGAQHASWYRKRRDGAGEPELLLDGEARAQGRPYVNIVNVTHSPDHKLLAWAEDEHGSEKFRIFVKDLQTGEILPHPVHDAYGIFVFSPDSMWLFWIWRDPSSRPSRVFRRPVRGAGDDVLIYEETDPAFLMNLSCTASKAYVVIRTWNAETSEVRLISAEDMTGPARVVEPRTPGLVYTVEDWSGRFVILTNADGATNFKLMWAEKADPSRRTWRDWIPYRPDRYITAMQPFSEFFVRVERVDANPQLIVSRRGESAEHSIVFDEPAYAATLLADQEYASSSLRFVFQSPRQPREWIAYDMATDHRSVLKRASAGSDYNKGDYIVERVFAAAEDGAQVPVTVLRRRSTKLDGTSPLLMYAYGSYGAFVEPDFSVPNLSLVDRGWVFAIAHVRGGSAKGWSWFLQARRLHKQRTFTDFIACAETLTRKGYSRSGRIVVHGLSAGGLLMGAVNNMRPGLWAGVIAQAPFVDMLNTMSDATHPLVPLTRPDWGDPLVDAAAYDSIASYSPYDNVRRQPYPPVLATTSVADDRVGYWEPAKWIAKLQACNTDANPQMLRVQTEGGHGGAAGRLAELRQMALFYAFAIWTVERHCSRSRA